MFFCGCHVPNCCKEILMKRLALHDMCVELEPTFYAESCAWKRESLMKMLSHSKPGIDVKPLALLHKRFFWVMYLGVMRQSIFWAIVYE